MIMPKVNIFGSVFLLLTFILIGIVFDMIGVSITSSDIKPFHSMNSKKLKGAKTAIKIIKNAPAFASICNDVIGDICGIISGSAGVIIANTISNTFHLNLVFVTLIITALIASLTIGGKAFAKTIAVKNSTKIILVFSKIISIFYK